MVFDSKVSRQKFIQLTIVRHLQHPVFYLMSLFCMGLIAYAIIQNDYRLIWAGVLPFLVYILLGVVRAVSASSNPNNPVLSRIEYQVNDKGLGVKTGGFASTVPWKEIRSWRILLGCYLITLQNSRLILIPQADIPSGQLASFEALLSNNVGRRTPW